MKLNIKANIPNILTFFRLFSAPIFIIIFYQDNNLNKIIAGVLFSIAGLSDFLDGYLARQWQVQSKIGKIFDPIADKLIVIAAIVMLIYHGAITGIHIFAAMIILLREVVISGLREALSGFNLDLPCSPLGKFKTVIQIFSINMLIFNNANLGPHFQPILSFLEIIAIPAFWIAAILSAYSGYEYIKKTINYLK